MKKLWSNFLLVWFIGSGIYGLITRDLFFVGIAILVLSGRLFIINDEKD